METMASQEPVLSRSVQVIKQEEDDLGLKGQDIVQYVKQQALDREERVAWRDVFAVSL